MKFFDKKNKEKSMKFKINKMTLHSKIAISSTIVLLLIGFVMFFILEFNNDATIGEENFFGKSILAMFYSVTLRTAGFNTFSLVDLTPASKFLSLFFMIIGGSPGGTAGGLKTVTIFAVIIIAFNTIKGNDQTVIFRRKIPSNLFSKALTIVIVYLTVFLVSSVMILASMPELDSLNVLYEVASALGTVGLTANVTGVLNTFSKFVIMACMFMGRLGPITLAVALLSRQNDKSVLDYPDENIMLG